MKIALDGIIIDMTMGFLPDCAAKAKPDHWTSVIGEACKNSPVDCAESIIHEALAIITHSYYEDFPLKHEDVVFISEKLAKILTQLGWDATQVFKE